MATPLLIRGGRSANSNSQSRVGLTLIELLVVLFIISVMLGLLLPAVQSARTTMQATACQNNLRQVEMALRGFIGTTKKFPQPNRHLNDCGSWPWSKSNCHQILANHRLGSRIGPIVDLPSLIDKEY